MNRFHSDNGAEFLALRKQFLRMRIEFTTSSAYTPLSNGVGERMRKTLRGKTKSMLHCAAMHALYWDELIMEVAHLYSSTAIPTLGVKTSNEKMSGTPSTILKYEYLDALLTVITTRSAGSKSSIEMFTQASTTVPEMDYIAYLSTKGQSQLTKEHFSFDETIYGLQKNKNRIMFDNILGMITVW